MNETNLFFELPDEIVLEIFKQLTEPQDLMKVGCVCRRFYHLSNLDSLWFSFFKVKFPTSKLSVVLLHQQEQAVAMAAHALKDVLYGPENYYSLLTNGIESNWKQVFLRRLKHEKLFPKETTSLDQGNKFYEKARTTPRISSSETALLWVTAADIYERSVARNEPFCEYCCFNWSVSVFETIESLPHKATPPERLQQILEIVFSLLQRCLKFKDKSQIRKAKILTTWGRLLYRSSFRLRSRPDNLANEEKLKQALEKFDEAEHCIPPPLPDQLGTLLNLKGLCLNELAQNAFKRNLFAQSHNFIEQAKNSYINALHADNNLYQARTNLGNLYKFQAELICNSQGSFPYNPEITSKVQELYMQSRTEFESVINLIEQNPDKISELDSIRHDLGKLLFDNAKLYSGTDNKLTESLLRQSIKLFEKIKQDGDYTMESYGISCLCLAKILIRNGQHEEAIIQGQKAIELFNKSLSKQLSLYNTACVYSVIGNFESCRNCIIECYTITPDPNFIRGIEEDPDFDNVRSLPWFKSLVQEFKSKELKSIDDSHLTGKFESFR